MDYHPRGSAIPFGSYVGIYIRDKEGLSVRRIGEGFIQKSPYTGYHTLGCIDNFGRWCSDEGDPLKTSRNRRIEDWMEEMKNGLV